LTGVSTEKVATGISTEEIATGILTEKIAIGVSTKERRKRRRNPAAAGD
jgi:hypothetical protein